MPSKTSKQKWFMKKACDDPKFAKEHNIDQKTACEFVKADEAAAEKEKKRKPAYVKWAKKK